MGGQVSTRVDLSPEPVRGYDRYTAHLTNGLSVVRVANLPIPAAGHLGVQEVTCGDEYHDAVTAIGGPHRIPCPTCRAVV